jgi:hypothetical protein
VVGESGAWNLPAAGRSEAVYKEIATSGPRKLADLMQALHRQPPTAKIGKLLYDIRAIVAPRL